MTYGHINRITCLQITTPASDVGCGFDLKLKIFDFGLEDQVLGLAALLISLYETQVDFLTY